MIESQLTQNQQLENNKKLVNVDKQQVYLDFKANEGQEYSQQITKNFASLQEIKQDIKVIVERA